MGHSDLSTSRQASRRSLKSRSAKSRSKSRSKNVICDSDKSKSVPCSGNLDRVHFDLRLINVSVYCVVLAIMLVVTDCGFSGVSSSPVLIKNPHFMFQGLSSMARNIRQLPCISRKSGEEGICMFAIDCLKSNGTHLGTCIDRFYFGSCCKISDKYISPLINEIEDNSINGLDFENKETPIKNDNNIDAMSDISTIKPSITTFKEPVTSNIKHELTTTAGHKTSSDEPNTTPTEQDVKETTPTTSGPIKVPTNPYVTITRKPVTKPEKTTTIPITTTEIPFRISTFQTVSDEQLLDKITTKKPVSTSSLLTSRPSTATSTPPSFNVTKPVVTTTELNNRNITSNTQKPTTISKPSKPTTKPLIIGQKPPSKPVNTTRPNQSTTFVNNYNRTTLRPSINYTRPKPTVNVQQNITKIPTFKPPPSRRPLPTRTPVTKPTSSPIIRVNITSISPLTTFVSTSTTERTITTSIKPIFTTVSTTAKETTTASTSPSTTTTTTTESTTVSTTERTTTTEATTISTLPSTTTEEVPTTFPATTITTIPTLNEEMNTEIPAVTLSQNTLAPVVPIEETPTITTSTYPPGISTWSTTVDAVTKAPEVTKTTSTVSDDAWSPITPPSDWVLLSTITTSVPEPNSSPPTVPDTLKPETIETSSSMPSSSSNPVATTSISEEPTPSSPITPAIVTTLISEEPTSLSPITPPIPSSPIEPAATAAETSSVSNVEISSSASSSSISLTDDVTEEPRPVFVVNITTSPMISTATGVPPATVTESTMGLDSTTKIENGTSISSNDTMAGTTESATTAKSTVSSIEIVTTPRPPAADSLNMSNYKEVCGRRLWPEARIVGGSKSSFGKWPWQISLRQWRTSTYLHKCGAALLNENWAITAAHCVEHVPPSELLVRLGEHDLANEDEPYGFQERRVQIVASHPHFDPATFEYDLALLRFYEPVTFQPNILPVCVPETDDDFVGKTAYVTGWGRLYDDGPLPSVLQEVTVPVINNTICESMYRSAGFNEHIPNIFICAGWKKGGFDSCEGDSGGPMVLQRPDNRFLLAGVISWGIGCAEPNQPGVYTRISEFREWINQILQF